MAETQSRAAYVGMGERIRERRDELAYSQRDLQRASGVSGDVIVKLEHDARRPRPSTIRRIAQALGVSVEWLTTGREFRDEQNARRNRAEVRPGDERNEETAESLERMFSRWMDEDEASGEPDPWPEMARMIDEGRTNYRKLFERE